MNKFYRWSESEKSGKVGSGDRFSSMGEAPGTRDEAVGSSVDIRHWLVSWWPTQSHSPVSSFCIAFSLGSWGLQKPEGVRGPQTIVFQDERGFQSEPYFTTFLLRVYSLSSLRMQLFPSIEHSSSTIQRQLDIWNFTTVWPSGSSLTSWCLSSNVYKKGS